uniref:tautomerase family protein n=1 Tax=Herbidospora sakaeratensis TaxID=564415 RepID=UPI000781B974|nr:4-oxalocrotonate tautomerase family protein [Herbidospora sakaeratensis]
MPLIRVDVLEGTFDTEEKERIVRDLTDAMVKIEGENLRPITWVLIDEVKGGEWGIGGKPYTAEDVQALAKGTEA